MVSRQQLLFKILKADSHLLIQDNQVIQRETRSLADELALRVIHFNSGVSQKFKALLIKPSL